MLKQTLFEIKQLSADTIAKGVQVVPLQFNTAHKPFEMTYFSVEHDCTTPLDQHAVAECWIILAGHGELVYNGEMLYIKPQDIFYFAPHQTHQVKTTSTEPLLICSIYWQHDAC